MIPKDRLLSISRTFVLLFLVVMMIGLGSAVECNADLSQGDNTCTLSNSLTLNGTI